MKLSKKLFKKISFGVVAIGALGLFVSFQNCSQGFNVSTQDFSSKTGSIISNQSLSPAVPAVQTQLVQALDLNNNIISSHSFFTSQNVVIQILGFDQNDTSVCAVSLSQSGSDPGPDCGTYYNLPAAVPGLYYGAGTNGIFSFNNGVWQANFRSNYVFDTLRVYVKNSKGNKIFQDFHTLSTQINPQLYNRVLVNGVMAQGPFLKSATPVIEIRAYGLSESDAYVCTQISDTNMNNPTYYVACNSGDYKKLPQPGWSYNADGVWIGKLNTDQFQLGLFNRIPVRNGAGVSTSTGILQFLTYIPPGTPAFGG